MWKEKGLLTLWHIWGILLLFLNFLYSHNRSLCMFVTFLLPLILLLVTWWLTFPYLTLLVCQQKRRANWDGFFKRKLFKFFFWSLSQYASRRNIKWAFKMPTNILSTWKENLLIKNSRHEFIPFGSLCHLYFCLWIRPLQYTSEASQNSAEGVLNVWCHVKRKENE